jgi:hypothetical protein
MISKTARGSEGSRLSKNLQYSKAVLLVPSLPNIWIYRKSAIKKVLNSCHENSKMCVPVFFEDIRKLTISQEWVEEMMPR